MRTVETDRLILRDWKLRDLDDLYTYSKNPNIGPPAGWKPHANKAVTLTVLHGLITRAESWAIVLKETGRVIGSVGLTPDIKRGEVSAKIIGYNIAEEQWGRGYATEATKAAVRYAFDIQKAEVVSITHYPFNIRSKRVIEKCGFVYEGTLRDAYLRYDGRIFDLACYSILRDEYYSENEILEDGELI